jgi:hypothetical protein
MDFRNSYPDFAAIETHIKRARVERSVAIAQFLADAIVDTWRGLMNVGAAVANTKAARPARPVATR